MVTLGTQIPAWKIQSEEETLIGTATDNVVATQQTTVFADEMAGVSVGRPTIAEDFEMADAVVDTGLTDFLSRPVKIATINWTQALARGNITSIDPWRLYFDSAPIKYKLNNFGFLRANLKVKIVVNASPFFYGAMRTCYQPLPNFKPNTIVTDATATLCHLVPYSQQPGLWILPQTSEGGEMTLPFFYQKNFVRAQVAQDFSDLGTLRFIVYSPLASANGATGSAVTVQIFAWAEDVVLAGPSVGLALQSTDEYGSGPVSGPASTVAKIAGLARGIPIIGKFATATEMGARAVAGIAKLFGFTNVPVIENTQPYRPSPFPQLASTELGYPVEKLTIDSKNELTIDPSSVGLESNDELAIEALVQRQSFLCQASWSTSDVPDSTLFNCVVTPELHASVGIGNLFKGYYTPMYMVAAMFNNWRGDIEYTFKIIASPFHKGRLRISYDPANAGVQTTADPGPVVHNVIVDLGKDTEVTMRIPYQQALAWQRSYGALSAPPRWSTTGGTFSISDLYANGIITMKVLTTLSAPVSTSSLDILIFVRGCDNMEFANPRTIGYDSLRPTPWAIQSVDEVDRQVLHGEDLSLGPTHPEAILSRNRVNFGESVRSVRPLLRRSNMSEVYRNNTDTAASTSGLMTHRQTRWPLYPGYDPGGRYSAKGLVVPASNFPYNYAQFTPYHWVANCFIGQRGSAQWHFNVDAPLPVQSVTVTRSPDYNGTVSDTVTLVGTTTSSGTARSYLNHPGTSGGVALTNQFTNSGLSVSIPNYTQFKFQSTDPNNIMRPPSDLAPSRIDGTNDEIFSISVGIEPNVNLNTIKIWKYFGVGTDFTLFYFLNVPTWYMINGSPAI